MVQFPAIDRLKLPDEGPAYRRLAHVLIARIEAGELRPGQSLPSERNLAAELGLSRVTVRAAYAVLVEEGLIEARGGSGNYVRSRPDTIEQPLWQLTSFSDDIARRGQIAESRVLDLKRLPADGKECEALALAPGEDVIRLERLRIADGRPLAIEIAFLPAKIVGDATHIGDGSLYAFLSARGLRPVRAFQRLRAVGIPREIAELLEIEAEKAGMFCERIAYLSDGRPMEYTCSYYRGDSYDFVALLNTSGETS